MESRTAESPLVRTSSRIWRTVAVADLVLADLRGRQKRGRVPRDATQVYPPQQGRLGRQGHRDHDGIPMTSRAELSSLATGLRDLIERVTSIADGLGDAERDSIGSELFEVERSLKAAERRMGRVLDR